MKTIFPEMIHLRIKQFFLLAFLLVFFPLTLNAQQIFPWRSIQETPFIIYYQHADSLNAVHFLKIFQEELPSINHEINAKIKNPIQIFIAPAQSTFDRLTENQIPHWGEAVAIPAQHQIIIKSPRWHRPSQNLKTIIMHEFVHVLADIACNHVSTPRWFSEGIAIYVSGDTQYLNNTTLTRAVASGETIHLYQIDGVFQFHQLRATLAYQESFAAIQCIIESFGRESIALLLDNIAKQGNFRLGFRATFGMSTLEFEKFFQSYLDEKYRFHLPIDIDTLLWIIIPFLFLAAVIARYYHNRKRLQRWEEDEQRFFYFDDENDIDSSDENP